MKSSRPIGNARGSSEAAAKAGAKAAVPQLYPRVFYVDTVVCWSCGHLLGQECQECRQGECPVPEHWTEAFRNRAGRCNGLAFPCDYETAVKMRAWRRPEPFPNDYYALVGGSVVFVHSTPDGRVYSELGKPCQHCGKTHQE
jgi:hypothetical protein